MPARIANAPLPVPIRQVVRRCLWLDYAKACSQLRHRPVRVERTDYDERVRIFWVEAHRARVSNALAESRALAGVDNPDWHHHLAIVTSVSGFLAQEQVTGAGAQ